MTDFIVEVQEQIRREAEVLQATFFRLAGLLTVLPRSSQETSPEDIDRDPDATTEVRAVTLCVMTDHLRPAVRDLLAAASYRPGEPSADAPDLFDQFYAMLEAETAAALAEPAGGGGAGPPGGREP